MRLVNQQTVPVSADGVAQAMIVTDRGGFILQWNRHAERLYGWPAREAIGQHVSIISTDRQRTRRILSLLWRGRNWAGIATVRSRDGTEFQVQVIASPVVEQSRVIGLCSVSIALHPYDSPTAAVDRRLTQLTERESEVLRLTARGLTAAQIGVSLGIGRRTVESHREHVKNKLGIRTRTELIVFAIRSGVIRIEDRE
jgi:PAS domain S-box-containing protein